MNGNGGLFEGIIETSIMVDSLHVYERAMLAFYFFIESYPY
jgi:hypothetical protein